MNAYTLIIQPQNGAPKTLRITASRVRLGRGAGDIPLDDAMVSARHAEFTFDMGSLVFTDVGSSNGSFFEDGRRITEPLELEAGMAVRLGQTMIRVHHIEREDGSEKTIVDPNFRWPGTDEPVAAGRPSGGQGGAPAAARSPQPAAPSQPAAASAGRDPGPAAKAASAKSAGASAAAGAGGGAQAKAAPAARPRPASTGGGSPGVEPKADFVELLKAGWAAFMALVQGERGQAQATADAPTWIESLTGGVQQLQAHIKTAPLVVGIVSVPLAVLQGLVFFVPSLAGIISLVSLVGSLAMLVATPASAFFVLHALAGKPITPKDAWMRVLKEPVPIILSMFVAGLVAGIGAIALIVPGIALGAFLLPALLVEERRMLAINARSVQMFLWAPLRILLVGLGLFAAMVVLNVVAGIVFGLIPWVGGFLAAIFSGVVTAVVSPLAGFVVFELYFDLRARIEGGDPLAQASRDL